MNVPDPIDIVGVVGTKGAFDRLVVALAGYAKIHPRASVWVQHGEGTLPAGLDGASSVGRASLIERMKRADAVVCHAGSGTLRDAMVLGHRPVVVPRRAALGEHVNDHQLELVEALGDRIVPLTEATRESLAAAITLAAASRGAPRVESGAELKAALRRDLERLTTPIGPVTRLRRNVVWGALRAVTWWWDR